MEESIDFNTIQELKNHHLWCYAGHYPCQMTSCWKYPNTKNCPGRSEEQAFKQLDKINKESASNVRT